MTVARDPNNTDDEPAAVPAEELVRSLAKLLDETGLAEIEIEEAGRRVRVARASPVYAAPAVAASSEVAGEGQITSSSLSLHELFELQARAMIERAELDEEQKQHILVAMSCPCCGAGAMSFTAKLRR